MAVEKTTYAIGGLEGVMSVTRREDTRIDVVWVHTVPITHSTGLSASYAYVKTSSVVHNDYWWLRAACEPVWVSREAEEMPPDFVAFVQLVLA